MKSPKDPVDHSRTTRPHAGESMTDTKNMPALIVIGLALVSFVGCLAAFATGHPDIGLMFASLAGCRVRVRHDVAVDRTPACARHRRTVVCRTSRQRPSS